MTKRKKTKLIKWKNILHHRNMNMDTDIDMDCDISLINIYLCIVYVHIYCLEFLQKKKL
jgi:hypothetical protein